MPPGRNRFRRSRDAPKKPYPAETPVFESRSGSARRASFDQRLAKIFCVLWQFRAEFNRWSRRPSPLQFRCEPERSLTNFKELLPLYTLAVMEATVEATTYILIDAAKTLKDSTSAPPASRLTEIYKNSSSGLCACGRRRSVSATGIPTPARAQSCRTRPPVESTAPVPFCTPHPACSGCSGADSLQSRLRSGPSAPTILGP